MFKLHLQFTFKFWYYYGGGYVKYYLGKAYTSLRFTLAVSDENENCLNPCEVTVYGDENEILYTSGELTRATTPQEIKVDVTGVEWLYIRSDSSVSGSNVTLLVADHMLYK